MRSKIVAGNWKMNKNLSETKDLLEELSGKLPKTDATTTRTQSGYSPWTWTK